MELSFIIVLAYLIGKYVISKAIVVLDLLSIHFPVDYTVTIKRLTQQHLN